MADWQATDAKARFSALLDAAATEGPQLVRRRKVKYVVTTEDEFERRVAEARAATPAKFLSAWDALKPSFDERFDDVDFPRTEGTSRDVDFG